MSERKTIPKLLEVLSSSDFPRYLSELIEELNKIYIKYPQDTIFIDTSTNDDCDDVEILFMANRLETDEDMKKRFIAEESNKRIKENYKVISEKQEYAQYLLLKEKYDKIK